MWATQTNEVSVHASVKEREENVQCVAGTHNLGEGTVEAAAFLRLFSTGGKLLHPLNVAQLHRNQGGGHNNKWWQLEGTWCQHDSAVSM